MFDIHNEDDLAFVYKRGKPTQEERFAELREQRRPRVLMRKIAIARAAHNGQRAEPRYNGFKKIG